MERCQVLKEQQGELIVPREQPDTEPVKLDSGTRHLFYELFVGREDTYSEEYTAQRRVVEQRNEPLTEEVLEEHLSGQRTIGTYVQRPNGTAKYLVMDLDISKKILLKYTMDSPEFGQYMKLCGETAWETVKILRRLGLQGYVESSGCRGYHVWIFFTEWIPVRYVNTLAQVIAGELGKVQKEEIGVEFFPDDRRMRAGKPGQSIKLPLGLNSRSGRMGYFLDESFVQVADVPTYLKNIARFSLSAVKRIIGMHAGRKEEQPANPERESILDRNLEEFGK